MLVIYSKNKPASNSRELIKGKNNSNVQKSEKLEQYLHF